MEFIIKETGKRVTVECRNERQDGCAEDVAINCGLDISLRDDEENAYVVSQEDADWWVEFFQTLNVCAEEIEGLEKKYSGEEICFCFTIKGIPNFLLVFIASCMDLCNFPQTMASIM